MSTTTLDDAMAALAAGVLEDGEHPSPVELLAYHADELADGDAARLREHLAWCSECARTVADMASWPDAELRDPTLERTAAEEAADWQAIRRRLGLDEAVPEGPTSSAKSPQPPFLKGGFRAASDRFPPLMKGVSGGISRQTKSAGRAQRSYGPVHLLAAVLALAVVGLSIQVLRLERPASTPQANVFVVDLEPAGDEVTRTTDTSAKTYVPAGMETVVFLLVRDDLRPFDDHAVELRGEGGEILWQTADLVASPEGGFSVAVPLAVLKSDAVDLRLYGVAGGKRELLATYRTRIERATAD